MCIDVDSFGLCLKNWLAKHCPLSLILLIFYRLPMWVGLGKNKVFFSIHPFFNPANFFLAFLFSMYPWVVRVGSIESPSLLNRWSTRLSISELWTLEFGSHAERQNRGCFLNSTLDLSTHQHDWTRSLAGLRTQKPYSAFRTSTLSLMLHQEL